MKDNLEDRPRYQRAKRHSDLVEDQWDLLWWMIPRQWNASDAVLAKDFDDRWWVEKVFDFNYYTQAARRRVPREIAEAAIRDHIVRGKPQWGYTSHREFLVSDFGKEELAKKVKEDEDA